MITGNDTVNLPGSYELLHFTKGKMIIPIIDGSRITATFLDSLVWNRPKSRFD